MIVSGQMTREEALNELKKPLYNEQEMQKEIEDICKLLKLSEQELTVLMQQQGKQHTAYKTDKFYTLFKKYFYYMNTQCITYMA